MNAAEIRKLIAENDLASLDRLEQEVYASMDDAANDVSELGDRLTNILGDQFSNICGIHEAQAWASSVTLSFLAVANSSISAPSLNPAK